MMNELEALLRRLVREEVEAALRAAGLVGSPSSVAAMPGRQEGATAGPREPCGATNEDGWICQKPRHRGRHRYTPRPHSAPARRWSPIQEASIQSGSRTRVIAVGNPVKVAGLGRGGGIADGYRVTAMERHQDSGKVNVEVIKPGKGQRSRVVPLDRIVYKRPK
jgi:hypothetical protein